MNTDKIIAEAIVKEYEPEDHSDFLELQKLNRKVKLPAKVFAYSFGLFCALVFGFGLCLSLKVLGSGSGNWTVAGIVIGISGFALMGVNYLLYDRIYENRKRKYSTEIKKLANRILEKQ